MFGKGSYMLLLQELLKDWPCTFIGERYNIPIQGITENSKNVKEGFMFIARKGKGNDGAFYIEEAIQLGAVVIVVDRPDLLEQKIDVPIVIVPDCRLFLSHACAHFWGNPSAELTVIAITGTNGKTTVSHFVGQLLHRLGVKTAVIGTLGVFIEGKKITDQMPGMTTVSAEYLHSLLRNCVERGVTHVILEASSLGLAQYRLEHCQIDIGVLLNIGVDHYDEHGGKQAYLEAKKKLFVLADQVVVNQDDPLCVELAREVAYKSLFYSRVREAPIHLQRKNDEMCIVSKEKNKFYPLPFHEDFNGENVLSAIAVLQLLAYSLDEVGTCLFALQLPEGRMQRIEHQGVTVIIDYAHTPDALQTVLQAITRNNKGNVLTIFGCGGNRDHGKRKEMGEVAARYSDYICVTSDNPRSEDPKKIIQDVVKGVAAYETELQIEANRENAIRQVIKRAKRGDTILIAGKGHEKTQQIGERILPFSDYAIVEQALIQKK